MWLLTSMYKIISNMSGKVGILIYIMIIIPHYYSPLSFCLATPFLFTFCLLYCVFKQSSVPTAVYNLHKVVPHHSLSSHWALNHDPYLSVKTCYFWVASKTEPLCLFVCLFVTSLSLYVPDKGTVDNVNRSLSVLKVIHWELKKHNEDNCYSSREKDIGYLYIANCILH